MREHGGGETRRTVCVRKAQQDKTEHATTGYNSLHCQENQHLCFWLFSEEELVLNVKDFPDIREGDIVEIYHPDQTQYR